MTGAWTMIEKRELASLRVCCVMYVMYVPVFCLPTRRGAASGCSLSSPRDPRSRSRASGPASRSNNHRSVCFLCRWQQILGKIGAQPSCVRHPRFGTPISRARSSTTTTTITSTTRSTPPNTTINSNPNPKSGCWSRSRSRTSRWSGSRTGSGEARKTTCSREKRKRRNGGTRPSDHWQGIKRKQCKRPQARQQAMQAEPIEAEPMQAEPLQAEGGATVCSMFCMSPHCDFGHVSRGVGRVFNVIRVPFLCFRSRLWEQLHCPARFWRPLYGAPRRQGPQHHAGGAEEVADPREG